MFENIHELQNASEIILKQFYFTCSHVISVGIPTRRWCV